MLFVIGRDLNHVYNNKIRNNNEISGINCQQVVIDGSSNSCDLGSKKNGILS